MTHAVCAVNQNFYAVAVGHIANFSNRQNMAGNIDHVTDHDHFGVWFDLGFVKRHDFVVVFGVVGH